MAPLQSRFPTILAFVAALLTTGTAQSQELRPFCPDRPGLGTPACTIDPGRVAIEMGALDWTVERDAATRTDTLVTGDILVRAGLSQTIEAQLGWTAFGGVRSRDLATGAIRRDRGTGDVTLALRGNLANPDGSGNSIAVMPFVTLPTGGPAIGAGDWGGGLIVPMSFALSDALSLSVTPRVEAAVDGDGKGRHAAYGSVIGLSASLTDALNATAEFQAMRDDDPAGRSTQALASLSLGWQPRDNLQFDIGAVGGLNAASPDFELYVGMAVRL